MKKLMLFLVIVLGWLSGQTQEKTSVKPPLSVIKENSNYLVVTYVKTEKITVGAVTTLLISKDQVVLDTIYGVVNNPRTMEIILKANYEELETKTVRIDSAKYLYNWPKFWSKKKVEKTFVLTRKNHIIYYDYLEKIGRAQINFEYLLILFFVIWFSSLQLTADKKFNNYRLAFMTVSFFLIVSFTQPSNRFLDFTLTGYFGFTVFGLIYVILSGASPHFNYLKIVFIYSLMSFMGLWQLGIMTLVIGLLVSLVFTLLKKETPSLKTEGSSTPL